MNYKTMMMGGMLACGMNAMQAVDNQVKSMAHQQSVSKNSTLKERLKNIMLCGCLRQHKRVNPDVAIDL